MTKFTASHGRYGARPGFAGLASLVLCAVLLLFAAQPSARAAEWMEPYLEQVQDWGVMYGDSSGNLNEDRAITRAEFVVMMNRAFGYTETGPNPFTDVSDSDWFAEDIRIAHQAGYFNGTSPTTASPRNLLSREQAASLLARCLRLEDSTGAATSFNDGNSINPTFRGAVQAAADLGIIQGYADGNFRPQANITRGQVACFLVRALGTLVQEPGEQIAGGVYGNLTINTSGVKLKDTVITGNLYLTGGVGLGNVELENVTVMGKIVLCGGGTSEKGEDSVILRNVTAEAMNVDSLTGQFLSIRAEGLTDVGTTTVRSPSYIEDMTENGLGLQLINLDAPSGTQLQLAGNIKEVVNLTPGSSLQVAQGVANTITMDEKAVGATLDIANMASVGTLNLDTATPVTGTGSVSNMAINTDGSTVTMLPDTITVRPGVNATVNGRPMDTVGAAESSEDPRLLSGYPMMRNVASTSAEAVFRTNKPGTVYWALTALIDGSVGEDTLMSPSTNARVIRSGTLNATASNTDLTARQTGLTRDGSYYISAMLVDNRGRKSPVKVVAFTTTDDTAPNFATGYPYTILTEGRDGEQVLQAMVMPTKDCQLYYALLPNNASAPTAADFRAGAVAGNLGFGVVDVKKNVPYLIPRVNSAYLEEQTTYNLYLWLNDADNNKSSAVRRLVVTTLDKTPPTITHITFADSTATSATFTFAMDEPGTLYWAVVKQGQQFYARVPDGTTNGRIPDPEESIAKIQVENGTNSLRSGRAAAAAGGTDYRFTITGLQGQTRYDLYFVAKDRAGNYNVYTQTLTPPIDFSTLDNEGPTVSQEFTHDGTDEGQTNPTPYPDTDIRLVFSETVQGLKYINGQPDPLNFLNLYQAVDAASGAARDEAKEALGEALHRHIKLYYRPASGQATEVNVRYDPGVTDDNWVIDFREAQVQLDPEGTGELIITFPAGTGVNLASGVTYYFTLEDITDTSAAANRMQGGTRGIVTLPAFTTINAQLVFSNGTASGNVSQDGQITPIIFDMNFRLSPVTTENVSDETLWDLIFWSSSPMTFKLYSREIGESVWTPVGSSSASASFNPSNRYPTAGVSISRELLTEGDKSNPTFEQLNLFSTDREYGIYVTELDGTSDRGEWAGTVSITIAPVAGSEGSLRTLVGGTLTPDDYETFVQNAANAVNEVGVPVKYTVTCPFRDTTPPTFIEGQPTFEPGDTSVMMNIQLSRAGHYYYVVAPAGQVPTTIITSSGQTVDVTATQGWSSLPTNGDLFANKNEPNATRPINTTISRPTFSGANYRMGDADTTGEWTQIPVTGLQPDTDYVVYFVLEGQSAISNVYAFGFHTEVISRPILRAQISNPTVTVRSLGEESTSTPKDAVVSYMVINSLAMGQNRFNLNQLMSTVWDETYAEAAGLTSAQIASARTTYQGMTLAEAMAAPYVIGTRNVGSVFDLFAQPAFQDSLGAAFETAQTSGTTIIKVGIQSEELNSNSRPTAWSSTIDCTRELTGKSGKYWFVAVGRSPMGSTYAFTAAQYLSDPTIQHPMITAINFTYDREESPSWPTVSDAANQSYTGILTITFDGPLYYADNGTLKQVVDTSNTGIGTMGNYISSALICTLPQGIELLPSQSGSSTATCQSLRFQITRQYQQAAINFNRELANEQGDYGNVALSLSLLITRENTGLYGATFQIDTDGWDARN